MNEKNFHLAEQLISHSYVEQAVQVCRLQHYSSRYKAWGTLAHSRPLDLGLQAETKYDHRSSLSGKLVVTSARRSHRAP